MNILVTGGSGFIGSHVVDKLIKEGYSVRVFDLQKPQREDVEWFKGSLIEEKEVLEGCRDIEAIFHLAAVTDVNIALSHPSLCLQVNEIGTLNLLKAGTAREIDRIVLASSTWVYGKTEGVVHENTPIPPPNHIYTKTKIGQEHLTIAWNEQSGLPYTILRYDIPYGPRMRSNLAIATFVRKAMRKETLTVFGDGNQGRCFIYVEDLAEGNVAALKSEGKNQIFNLAASEFVTVNQVVKLLQKNIGGFKIEKAPVRPGDFKGAFVNIDKAERLLGWQPKTPFEEGLRKYIEYVKAQKKA
jgi:UDP-glucose 4-epimerase